MALCLWLQKQADQECFSAYAGLKQLYVMKGLYFSYMYHNICCDDVFVSYAAYLYAGQFRYVYLLCIWV